LKVFWSLPNDGKLNRKFRSLWMAVFILAWGCIASPQISHQPAIQSPVPRSRAFAPAASPDSLLQLRSSLPSSIDTAAARTGEALDSCHVYAVTSLPGSHQFASDFIETMVTDPKDSHVVWALTADLSDQVPAPDRAIYISKSSNSGKTWAQVARVDSRYFDANIAEGLRNGFAVSPDGTEFVITTQEGAFEVFPQSDNSAAVVKAIAGPRIPEPLPRLSIPKHVGDPVRANVVAITADGKHMIVGYGYFDLNPQLFTYRRNDQGLWIEEGRLPHLPTDLDIFSMQFEDARKRRPDYLYVGTGDQAFRLNLRTRKWTRITGVGADSSIHSMTTVGGLHLAACWGVYEPVNAGAVARVTHARFLLHRAKDEVGPNIRAYGIEVDPARHNRQILTAITGVYVSEDGGTNWKRLNDLPEGEFHSAHFNPDGTVIVSGFAGTFLVKPFSNACAPHLKIREK
jgi:hypothetical protein